MALGDITNIKGLIVSVDKSATSRGGDMLKIRYTIEGGLERNSVMFENRSVALPDPNEIAHKVCELQIEESSYNGKPSTKILKVTPTEEDRRTYLRKPKIDVEAALAEMQAAVAEDKELGPVVAAILFDNKEMVERFKSWPAAKNAHHAFDGGLIEHTYMMFKLAIAVLDTDVATKGLDRNVVLASIILHDIGKIYEYDYEAGVKTEVSTLGTLLGHISICDSLIVRACLKKNIPAMVGRVLQVRHCVLSHHGTKDWGSPVVPSTREAVLVHYLDNMQARSEIALEAAEQVEEVGKGFDSKFLDTRLIKWQ
jgi:3'-5' exoribonuclease